MILALITMLSSTGSILQKSRHSLNPRLRQLTHIPVYAFYFPPNKTYSLISTGSLLIKQWLCSNSFSLRWALQEGRRHRLLPFWLLIGVSIGDGGRRQGSCRLTSYLAHLREMKMGASLSAPLFHILSLLLISALTFAEVLPLCQTP